MNEPQIKFVLDHTEEFFAIVKRADAFRGVSGSMAAGILTAFFTAPERCQTLIKDAEIYFEFCRGAVRCRQGYLLSRHEDKGWKYGFLVTEDAEVYQFARRGSGRRSSDAMQEAVIEAVREKLEIKNLKKATPNSEEIQRIVSRVGKLNPSIALVLGTN